VNNLFPVEDKYYVTDLFWTLIIVVNGSIKGPQDEDIESNVMEIIGSDIKSHTLHARLTQLQHITFRASNSNVWFESWSCFSSLMNLTV